MLSENLKRLRKEKGLSQEELATTLHVVRQTVSKWEKGLSSPDSNMLVMLADALGTTVSELLGEGTEKETSDAPTDPTEQQSPKKRPGLVAALCAGAVILLSTTLLVLLALGLFTPVSPLVKTMEAVFPELALLEDMTQKGGALTLHATLNSDLGDKIGDEPILVNAQVILGKNGLLLAADAGTDQEKLDVSLLLDEQGAQLSSERMLDGGYSISFENMMDALDRSIFAPDSGTDYALPNELYDAIKQYWENDDEEPELPSFEQTEKVLELVFEAALQEATETTEKKSVVLTDGSCELTLTTKAFDSKALRAATDVLFDQWKNNEDFREELKDFMDLYVMESEGGESVDPDELLDNLMKQLKSSTDAMIKSWKSNSCEWRVTYAVRSGYVVYMQLQTKQEIAQGTGMPNISSVMQVEWKFSSNPGKDASYTLTMSTTVDEQKTELLNVTYRQEKTRFTLQAEVAEELTGEALTLSVTGERDVTSRKSTLLLDGMDVKRGEKSLLNTTSSTFGVTLQSGAKKVKRETSNTDLLGMTVEDMDALFEGVEQKFEQFQIDLNRSVGYEMIYDNIAHRTQAKTEAPNVYDYAYDAKTGHLFIATADRDTYYGPQYYIIMYDAKTMVELKRMQVESEVLLDADNGYLIYGLCTPRYPSDGFDINVLDAETMNSIKTMPLKGMTGVEEDHLYVEELIIDGNTISCLAGMEKRQILFIDVNRQDVVAASGDAGSITMDIDRKNHVIGVLETHGYQNSLAMYNSITGELILLTYEKKYPNHMPVTFDGSRFQCHGNYHYDMNGYYWYTEDIFALRQPIDPSDKGDELVYWDENIMVITEYNGEADEELQTVIYERCEDGSLAKMFDVSDLTEYAWVIRLGENEYLVVYTQYYQYAYAERFAVEPSHGIDF